MRYKERIYIMGDYAEVRAFPVFPKARARRNKLRPTDEVQARLNEDYSERNLIRLIHANFTGNDLAVHPTFADGYEPESAREALRLVQNYVRRLKRRYTAAGAELKYIYSIEYASRWHVHMIISGGVDRDTIEECWGMGYANADRLQFNEHGITDLTIYISKERSLYRRYCYSKNLKQPQILERSISGKEFRRLSEDRDDREVIRKRYGKYGEYIITESESIPNPVNGYDYMSFNMCRLDAKLAFTCTPIERYIKPKKKGDKSE